MFGKNRLTGSSDDSVDLRLLFIATAVDDASLVWSVLDELVVRELVASIVATTMIITNSLALFEFNQSNESNFSYCHLNICN